MRRPWLLRAPANENELFKIEKFEIWFLGCWSYPNTNRLITYSRGIIHIILLILMMIPQYMFAYENWTTLVLLLEVLCPLLTQGVTLFKHFILFWRTKELNNIFDEIKHSFENGKT